MTVNQMLFFTLMERNKTWLDNFQQSYLEVL